MPNKQSAKVWKSKGNERRRNSIHKQDQTRSNNTKSHGNPSGNGNKKFGNQTNTNNAATGFTGAEEKNEMKELSTGIVANYGQFADSPSAPDKENMDENVIQNEKLQEEKLKLLGGEIDEESNFDELEFEALWQKEVVGTLSAASHALEKISKMSKKSKKSKRNKKENKDEAHEITDVSEEKTEKN